MAYNFSTLSPDQAVALIRRTDTITATTASDKVDVFTGRRDEAAIRAFLAGDHWQGGEGWVGPKPTKSPGTLTSDEFALHLIHERFVSRNMIEDITTRHVDGVLGRAPRWLLTPRRALKNAEKPTDVEQKEIDEAEAALTAWWDKRECWKLFQDGAVEALASGRVVIRLYVPVGRLQPLRAGPKLVREASGSATGGSAADGTTTAPEGGEEDADATPELGVVAATLEEALDHIYVEVVTAENATVFTDADTQERVGIVIYYGEGPTPGTVGPRIVELSFLEGSPDEPLSERGTIIRRMSAASMGGAGILNPAEDVAAPALPLGGRLTHYAVKRQPLVSSQIVALQKALNFAISMLPRNVETSGFLERILLNAQLPGTWDVDPTTGLRTGHFTPSKYVTGGGVTSTVTGAEITQPDGTKVLATPAVQFRPPSDVTPTINAVDQLEAEILLEAKQGHVLGTDQVISGISREQARADFEKSLSRTEAAINPAGRWLLETALALGELFANIAGQYSDNYRAEFECYADTGPLDTREIADIITAQGADLISDETAMSELGVEDTDSELAKLNAQDGRRVTLRTKKAAALKAFTDAGLSLPAACKLAGFSDDEQKIITDDANNPLNAPPALPGAPRQARNPDGSPKVDENGNPVQELTPPAENPSGIKPTPPPKVPGFPPSRAA